MSVILFILFWLIAIVFLLYFILNPLYMSITMLLLMLIVYFMEIMGYEIINILLKISGLS